MPSAPRDGREHLGYDKASSVLGGESFAFGGVPSSPARASFQQSRSALFEDRPSFPNGKRRFSCRGASRTRVESSFFIGRASLTMVRVPLALDKASLPVRRAPLPTRRRSSLVQEAGLLMTKAAFALAMATVRVIRTFLAEGDAAPHGRPAARILGGDTVLRVQGAVTRVSSTLPRTDKPFVVSGEDA